MNHYYDNNGNEIKTMKGNTIYEEKTYNKFNELISLKKGNQTAKYTYKPDGIRLSKDINNNKTNFVTVDGKVFAELNGSGAVTEDYIRDMNNIIRGSKVYYLYNGHGDVTQLANFSGIVTKIYDYDSYGVDGKNNWYDNFYNNDTNPWRYCGEYFDYETKTVYLRARNYAPNTGRFNSEDPARAELNWYTYCNGNPVNRIDPSGLESYYIFYNGNNDKYNKSLKDRADKEYKSLVNQVWTKMIYTKM